MTTTLTPFEEEKLREFETIDYSIHCLNPKCEERAYLVGELQDFLLSSLHQQREMIRKEFKGKLEDLLDAELGRPDAKITMADILSLLSNKEIKQ